MKHTSNPSQRLRGRGFTLIELLVAIAIAGLLAALAIPALSRANDRALEAKCLGNLRQIGIAFQGFLSDNNGTFPDSIGGGTSNRWVHALDDYAGAEGRGYATEIFHCPRARPPFTTAIGLYGFNDYLAGSGNAKARRKVLQIARPSAVVVMAEHAYGVDAGPHLSPDSPFPTSHRGAAANHERGKTPDQAGARGRGNYLFADWHIETLKDWPGRNAFDPSLP